MKKLAFILTTFILASCSGSFSYKSPAGQEFDSTVTIIIPVESSKK